MIRISKLREFKDILMKRSSSLADVFGFQDRLYIDFKGAAVASRPHWAVRAWLRANGYRCVDYRKGLVQRIAGGSPIRLGRLLRLNNTKFLLGLFVNDPLRSAIKKDLMIVVSRHPYDILGSAHGRGWRSCFDIESEKGAAIMRQEIARGTIVFYLCEKNDKNIQRPIARVLFGKFIDHATRNTVFHMLGKVYGTDVSGFTDACFEFLAKHGYSGTNGRVFASSREYVSLQPEKCRDKQWKTRLKAFMERRDPAAKYDPHHLVRRTYYDLTGDSDAKYDENISIRYLYFAKNPDDPDAAKDKSPVIRSLALALSGRRSSLDTVMNFK